MKDANFAAAAAAAAGILPRQEPDEMGLQGRKPR
jgi:hypothetical protein